MPTSLDACRSGDCDTGLVQAADPHLPVVLPDPGGHVEAAGVRIDVVDEAPGVVVRLDPDGALRLRLEPLRDTGGHLAHGQWRPPLEVVDDRVPGRGDGHPDQPIGAAGDVVGVAGEVAHEDLAAAGA